VSCKNGAVLELSCQGSPGVVSRRCPISNESDICVSLLDHRDCQLLSLPGAGNGNSDDLSITCECSLEYLSKPMMSDDSPTTINFGVMTRSVSHDFVSTWLSADDMSGGAVLSNLTVLFSTVGVSIMGGIVMFVSLLLDKLLSLPGAGDGDRRQEFPSSKHVIRVRECAIDCHARGWIFQEHNDQ
jgi:hypothetical protein